MIAIAIFVFWAAVSAVALWQGWAQIFAAMGSLLLSLAVAVFLTERYEASERHRLWDHDLQGQLRVLAAIANRAHDNSGQGADPRPLYELQGDLEDSLERMTVAKHNEEADETWREEMIFSITGTLQWGFGALLIDLIHG